MSKLNDLELRVRRIERISWTVLGAILTKAGIDLMPLVSAFFA